ncbi:MAG: mannose-1-phosphate guanylyltransferase/mannose-6-phosphate isomerase [Candidatus Korarchaeota archaeon]|nr:mannose-1-phosphate guanylyltransferase/mannose-6-phosphate isomerase [Candidatus Korarchaeota archaeon]
MKVAMILAGGFGTRLWPLSRKEYPKQFAKVVGNYSTYQQSLMRARMIADDLVVVTSEMYKYQTIGQAREVDVPLEERNLVLEPARKDTAPAIYYGILHITSKFGSSDPTITVFPSDHMILNESELLRALNLSIRAAEMGKVGLVAVPPTKPEPGFGYIKAGREIEEGIYLVEEFVEKPGSRRAAEMIEEGSWYWSTMIMSFKASHMMELIEKTLPGVTEPFKRFNDPHEAYKHVQKVDVSSGTLSKVPERLAIIPTENLGWSDLGSFESIYELLEKDDIGNALSGRVKHANSRRNLVLSKRLVALVNVEDMIVVDDEDAILVMPKGSGQELKSLIEQMLRENVPEVLRHRVTYEQWGLTTILLRGEGYEVRRVKVYPGKGFGPQKHYHRSIYWQVLSGTARVVINGEEKIVTRGSGLQVPVGASYKLSNPGKIPLEMIEIATGEYLGQDDIDESGF